MQTSRSSSGCLTLFLVALFSLSACYGRSGPIAPTPYLAREQPAKVRVVTTQGSARTVFAPRLVGDSLVGHAGDSTLVPTRRPNTPVTILLSDIAYLTVDRIKPGRTLLFIVATPVALLTVVCLAGACDLFPAQ